MPALMSHAWGLRVPLPMSSLRHSHRALGRVSPRLQLGSPCFTICLRSFSQHPLRSPFGSDTNKLSPQLGGLRRANLNTRSSLFDVRFRFCASSPQSDPKQPNTRPGGESTPNAVGGFRGLSTHSGEEQKQEGTEDGYEAGGAAYNAWIHLPFMPPFHTVNIVMILILANLLTYLAMAYLNDDWRDWIVEHFTLSHANAHRLYPFLTCSLYQEHFLQLAIDVWLLVQFGKTMLGFLGGVRMAAFWAMCCVGGGTLHLARQYVELAYGMDPTEVRGRCFGPNPFILGLVAVEGLIFRHLNFMQNPPIPFLVLTAFVMIIDVWRIFTTKPQEHGAATGGALVAYVFWRLPTRAMGLDRLTATV